MNLLFQAAQQARLIRERQELIFWTTCGPTTTFDPKITGVSGTWYFDDGTTLAAASGVEISKTFAAEGLHRAVFRPASGGLAAITAIDCNADLVTSIWGLNKTVGCTNYSLFSNTGLNYKISELVGPYTYLAATYNPVSGTLSQLRLGLLAFYCNYNNTLPGSLADLPPSLTVAQLYGSTVVTAGSVAHLIAIRDLRIYSMGWLTADVDTVIDSMWAARANYTYATPSLNIGGTNQAPSGNVIAPEEGADWTEDTPGHWLPRTTGAKAYDLAKDVNSEGFNKWTITYTGGVVAP